MNVVRALGVMAAPLFLCATPAHAAGPGTAYPLRPVRMIVPFPPGSSDVTARIIAQKAGERVGQQFVVDNRGGATGTIGTYTATKAAADGYTLLFHTCTLVIGATLQKNLPYRVPQDFTAVAQVAWSPMLLVVNRALAVNSVQELIALAKAKPDTLNYASIGTGSLASLSAAMFKAAAGVRLTEVNYQGTAPALTALLSGETQLMFSVLGAALPQVRGGRMKALAMASAHRSPLLPDLPTVAEAGLPGFDAMCWHGVFGPRGLPPAVVEVLNKNILAVLDSAETRAQFAALGFETAPTAAAQFAAFLQVETGKWTRAMAAAGVPMAE
jgi:tripartite-type tricarboxylate transporter receptor subunit TctC